MSFPFQRGLSETPPPETLCHVTLLYFLRSTYHYLKLPCPLIFFFILYLPSFLRTITLKVGSQLSVRQCDPRASAQCPGDNEDQPTQAEKDLSFLGPETAHCCEGSHEASPAPSRRRDTSRRLPKNVLHHEKKKKSRTNVQGNPVTLSLAR